MPCKFDSVPSSLSGPRNRSFVRCHLVLVTRKECSFWFCVIVCVPADLPYASRERKKPRQDNIKEEQTELETTQTIGNARGQDGPIMFT